MKYLFSNECNFFQQSCCVRTGGGDKYNVLSVAQYFILPDVTELFVN